MQITIKTKQTLGLTTDTVSEYSSNSSNNPYRFDHLHKSESSVEQGKPAEDLQNNTVTDANMVKEEQNVPKLLRGGGADKN